MVRLRQISRCRDNSSTCPGPGTRRAPRGSPVRSADRMLPHAPPRPLRPAPTPGFPLFPSGRQAVTMITERSGAVGPFGPTGLAPGRAPLAHPSRRPPPPLSRDSRTTPPAVALTAEGETLAFTTEGEALAGEAAAPHEVPARAEPGSIGGGEGGGGGGRGATPRRGPGGAPGPAVRAGAAAAHPSARPDRPASHVRGPHHGTWRSITHKTPIRHTHLAYPERDSSHI